jgi:pimeloyl-ACP methyl ester carboxylesterase
MKSKVTLVYIFLVSFFATAQNQENKFDLLKDKTQTKILYDRVFSISNATNLDNKPVSSMFFKQVYHEIQRADFLERLPKYDYLKEQTNLGFAENKVPLSILITEFESQNKTSIESHNFYLDTNEQWNVKSTTNAFDKHNLTLIAPLLASYKSTAVTFVLKENLIFNTTNKSIQQITADFNDGKGFRVLTINQSIKVEFLTPGKQNIQFRIQLSNGEIINQSATFQAGTVDSIFAKNANATQDINTINTISSTIPYQGYGETQAFLGQAEYEIFPDVVNGILDKPIFLLDGFDPGDARKIPNIYSLMNYGTTGSNLADDLRAQGFDVIILNFPTYTRPSTTTVIDGGVDYIQRNAMILVELINQINLQKVGTEKNVVIGPSMGGLIARYGLRYMETNNLNHDTRLYISFDAPHLGANAPIGFQHLFNYMGYGPLGDVLLQGLVDGMFKSPAGREMLIDQFEGHLQTGSVFEFNTSAASLLPTGCPNYRTPFQNELNAMGFPLTTRNVAIANGAGNGTMTGTPDMVVMNHTFNTTTTQRAVIDLRFTPLANQTNQASHFKGQQQVLGIWFTGYESMANSKAPTTSSGLDSAPGGRFDMSTIAATAGTNVLLTEFFNNLLIQYFDFIPTNSALSITNTSNWYQPVALTSNTPFLAQSVPSVNENHVTLNAQNTAFALNEILNPPLAVEHTLFSDLFIKNPIQNTIEISSAAPITDATVTLVDVLGKTMMSKSNQTIDGNYQIPIVITKGIYFLTIKNTSGNVTRKLIKE